MFVYCLSGSGVGPFSSHARKVIATEDRTDCLKSGTVRKKNQILEQRGRRHTESYESVSKENFERNKIFHVSMLDIVFRASQLMLGDGNNYPLLPVFLLDLIQTAMGTACRQNEWHRLPK